METDSSQVAVAETQVRGDGGLVVVIEVVRIRQILHIF